MKPETRESLMARKRMLAKNDKPADTAEQTEDKTEVIDLITNRGECY